MDINVSDAEGLMAALSSSRTAGEDSTAARNKQKTESWETSWEECSKGRIQRGVNLGFLVLDRQVEFKLCWKLILRIQPVWEVDASYSTVCMNLRGETARNWVTETFMETLETITAAPPNLDTQRLDVIGSVGPPGEVWQIELNLVPAVVQSHWHGANKRLHSCRTLIITCPKSPADIFVIQHLKVVTIEQRVRGT